MFSFWVTIKIPFLDHLIFVQGFCSCGFPREAVVNPPPHPPFFSLVGGFFSAVYRVLTLIPHGIRVFWDALGSLFCGPLGLFYYARATLALSGNIFLCFSWDHLDPTLPCFTTCCIFLIYFFFGHFCHFIFSIFCFRC